ncbi:MAG: NADH-quinone oxidoreductase subunit C [Acidithiobacillus sp.]
MSESIDDISQILLAELGQRLRHSRVDRGELTVELEREGLLESLRFLRDDPRCDFQQLIDLCGVDYSEYGEGAWTGPRFAVVYHLLSLHHHRRLRVRVYLDEELPILPSAVEIWPAANWFEREAFDLFGFLFDGHPDLRRILTDYGFVGHPFRKDFPLVGTVEMRYDADQRRVVYEPTRTEERVVVPRILRIGEEGRYDAGNQ